MCETVCKSVCFVSFRQELPAPHDPLSPHVFILCPFRYQPRYYRFRPFSEPEPGDIVSQIRHFFLRLLQGLKAQGEAVIRHLQTAFLRFRAAFSASAMHKQAWHGARLNRKVPIFALPSCIGNRNLRASRPQRGSSSDSFVKLHFPVVSTSA